MTERTLAEALYVERGSLYCGHWSAAEEFAPRILRALRAAGGDEQVFLEDLMRRQR